MVNCAITFNQETRVQTNYQLEQRNQLRYDAEEVGHSLEERVDDESVLNKLMNDCTLLI